MAGLTKVKGSGLATGAATDSLVGIDDNATSTAITIDSSENTTFAGSVTADGATNYPIKWTGAGGAATGSLYGDGSSVGLMYGDSSFATGLNFTTNTLKFRTGSTERLRIDSTGNVGIGTSSPARQLTLSNSGAALLSLVSTGSDNCQVLFGDSASDTVGKVLYSHVSNHMALNTNGTERMRIDASGNVGIGTSSPTEALTMYGNKKHLSNHGYGSNYTHIKYVTGDQPQTAVTFQIPATKCFIGIEMFFINSRIPASNPSTSRIGRKYFTIARNGSGNDVVLDQGYSDDWTALSTSVGGAYPGGSGATTIVRTGSEANTATQGVKITFLAGNPGNTGGYGVLKFDILSNILDSTGFSIT